MELKLEPGAAAKEGWVYEVEVTDEFVAWWNQLTEMEQEALAARVDLLEREGPAMRRPYCGEIRGSQLDPQMKELICDVSRAHLRVLFLFNPLQVAILLVGGDKTGSWNRWYDQYVPIADQLYKEHLVELSEEGLL